MLDHCTIEDRNANAMLPHSLLWANFHGPENYTADDVVMTALTAADGHCIGVTLPGLDQRDSAYQQYAGKRIRRGDRHFSLVTALPARPDEPQTWKFGAARRAPWYDAVLAGRPPILLFAHVRCGRVVITVRQDGLPTVCCVSGDLLGTLVANHPTFHRALVDNPASPVVLPIREFGEPHPLVGPPAAQAMQRAGVDRDIHTVNGVPVLRVGKAGSWSQLGIEPRSDPAGRALPPFYSFAASNSSSTARPVAGHTG
ncbi:hypothetical protein [Nocardia brasiliensis]|uniref:hypothetical protein n=1 Tax=Nocardia brasiliensis TaxID=37326 RepID=UPI002453B8D6|nr:hypothetical protein [Nocardia brasiliensis]